jgi:hypothetical protein
MSPKGMMIKSSILCHVGIYTWETKHVYNRPPPPILENSPTLLLCYAKIKSSRNAEVDNFLHEIYTFRTLLSSNISFVVGSLTSPGFNPALAHICISRSRPYILPFGKTTGSFSTALLLWWAYGRFRASSLSSVEQIGQTDVVVEPAFELLLA